MPPRRVTFVDLHHTSSIVAERLFRLALQNKGYMIAGVFDNASGFDFYLGSAGVQTARISCVRSFSFNEELLLKSDLIIVTNEAAQEPLYNRWAVSPSMVLPAFVQERNLAFPDEVFAMEGELGEKLGAYLPEKKR